MQTDSFRRIAPTARLEGELMRGRNNAAETMAKALASQKEPFLTQRLRQYARSGQTAQLFGQKCQDRLVECVRRLDVG